MNIYARFNHSSYDITKLFELFRFSENISISITYKPKVTEPHTKYGITQTFIIPKKNYPRINLVQS